MTEPASDENRPDFDSLEVGFSDIPGVAVQRSVPAGELCSYRVGGPIQLLVRVESTEALAHVTERLADARSSCLPIGKGSNLLVSDDGFDGVAIVLGAAFDQVSIEGTTVVAGAGAFLPVVARASVGAGLTGFEWAVGVPGSIGGAVRMNAGGHGSDMATSLRSIDVADLSIGGIVTRGAGSLDLGYRRSNLEPGQIVISATLDLTPAPSPNEGSRTLREIVSWRREHQPGGPNAGSVFTNPANDSAGRLIDDAGLKGYRIGTAEVSEKHANFIQVDPGGSANDVMQLMIAIVDRVEQRFGVRLHAETRLVGFAQDLVDHVQPTGHGEGQ